MGHQNVDCQGMNPRALRAQRGHRSD